jgi:hypothetical protein
MPRQIFIGACGILSVGRMREPTTIRSRFRQFSFARSPRDRKCRPANNPFLPFRLLIPLRNTPKPHCT